MIAFERLHTLGEERFGKILNQLMRGEPARGLARLIQMQPPEGWGLFQDLTEKALSQQLRRLRLAAAEGAFGKKTAQRIEEGATPQIKMLEKVSVRVLDRLEELSDIQRQRVLDLIEKEKKLQDAPLPLHKAASVMFNDYRQLLLDIQKVRFDLGLDDFKGPVGTTALRGATSSVTLPDGTNVQKQVFEAVTAIEEILNARNIPQLPQ